MNEQQKTTLLKWRARHKRSQLAHNYTTGWFNKLHIMLGILLVCLSTASTVLIFAQPDPKWLSPAVGISAALFAYLQTFLQLSQQAEVHRSMARQYGELKKRIEYIIDFQADSLNISDIVEELRLQERDIASSAPNCPRRYWDKASKATEQENEQTSIRNKT